MEILPYDASDAAAIGIPVQAPVAPAGFNEVMDAAFFTENDVANLARFVLKPAFPADTQFNVVEALKDNPFAMDRPEQMARAQSQAELDYITQQIQQENAARGVLAGAGVGGFLAAGLAGLVSPVSLIPFAGPARGIKGVGQAFAIAGGTVTAQEATLFGLQETRTAGEVFTGIAAGTVLGGLLGSAGRFSTPAERVQLEQGMASRQGQMTVSQLDDVTGEVVETRFNTIKDVDIPVFSAKSKVGDEVTVYRPTGEATIARVAVPSRDAIGIQVFTLPDGSRVRRGQEVFDTSPVSPKATIEINGARVAVADLTPEQLAVALARTAEEIPTERINAATYEQKALTSEQARRNGEPVEAEVLATREVADDSAYAPDGQGGGRSVGAATVKTRTDGIFKPGPIRGKLIGAIARLNPLHRLIDGTSAAGRNYAAMMSLGGIRIANGVDNGPASGVGTGLARRDSLGVHVTDFIEDYDAAYVEHIFGSTPPGFTTKGMQAALATAKGNLRAPEGKLNYKDFEEAVFDSANIGTAHPDPSVQKGTRALLKYFREMDEVNEAYARQREFIDGEDFVPLYTRLEFGEDSDVQNYVHHLYDSVLITNRRDEFLQDLTAHGNELAQRAFRKSFDRHADSMIKDMQRFTDLAQPKAAFAKLTKQIADRVAKFDKEFGPEVQRLDDYGKELSKAGVTGPARKEAMSEFREALGTPFLDARRAARADRTRLKELLAERNPIWDKRTKANAPKQDKASREFYTEITARDFAFEDRWKSRGGDDIDVRNGTADFLRQSRLDAQTLFRNITGNPHRVIGVDLIGEARGPQLQRTLNLPYEVKRKYLDRRPESVVRAHNYSMAPDLEMYRMTGSPNGKVIFEDMNAEYLEAQNRLDYSTTEEEFGMLMGFNKRFDPTLREQIPITRERRDVLNAELKARHDEAITDMQTLVDRFRNERGRPADANAMGYRMGRFARNLNVTRFMGTVVPSSLPDVARPVMRYGLESTFSHAWKPLVTDLKLGKMSNAAARRMNIATESITHNRAQAMFDVGENFSTRQTMVERGMETLANKTGFVALFDRWTDANKRLTSRVVFGEFSHNLNVIAQGTRGPDYDKALIQMNRLSLSEDTIARINRQFDRPGGSDEVAPDFRLPNTKEWDDFDTVMAMNAAVNQEVNDLIVTPGLDRPSWTDANEAYRVVAQFRSYSFASTNRIIMSGLQDSDMAYLNGTMMALALGGISYYAWGITAGGTMQERMMESTSEQWAYEALQRSGMLGVLSEGTRIGEQIPGLNDFAIFGGEGSNSRRASSVMGAVLGPSYDLGERLISIVQGLDEPTQSTLHSARVSMVPYQNVFYLRRLLDVVQAGLGQNLPETRGQ